MAVREKVYVPGGERRELEHRPVTLGRDSRKRFLVITLGAGVLLGTIASVRHNPE